MSETQFNTFPDFLSTFLPFCFVILVLLIFYFSSRDLQKTLKTLVPYLRGSVSKVRFPPVFLGDYQGLKVSVSIYPQGKSTPPYAVVTLYKTSFFKLSIAKESVLNSLGKTIGFLREVKISDELFDKEFLILSNKPPLAQNYLSAMTIKTAVRELFSNGFDTLKIDYKKIFVRKPCYNLKRDFLPQEIVASIQTLSIIAQGL